MLQIVRAALPLLARMLPVGLALNAELEQIAAAGFTWVRQNFLWSDIEKTQGKLDFSRYDAAVDAVWRQVRRLIDHPEARRLATGQ